MIRKLRSESRLFSINYLPVLILVVSSLSACASSPSKQFQEFAQRFDVQEKSVVGAPFEHAVFSNAAFDKLRATGAPLHIYIDGDGEPFLHRRFINQDPTSREAIALKLMVQDSQPALLVGRPCYHGYKNSYCDDTKMWTSHRYSDTVIKSLAKAINDVNIDKQRVTLIGFSGGGSLAILLSERVQFLNKVITINANLDTEAWTAHHGYTPLFGSLNPVDTLPLKKDVTQLHLVGGKDQNVLHAAWSERAEASGGKIIRFADFTHTCCWQKTWPSILKQHIN